MMEADRCWLTGKKIFESKAAGLAQIGAGTYAMNVYFGTCGHWHVGHRKGHKGPKGRGVGA